ncbi:MAG: cytochrome b/b6 domain-containing protein [Chloroflexi bacterium]|nr:cytochrome b/b6 domain-containing protein [Chloroflexota bacterium]
MSEQKQYLRFSVAQRIEHWAQMISFTVLGATGLPQKFAGEHWAEEVIRYMGGIETVRNIHHFAAIIMSVACIYHAIALAYKVLVLRVRWTMFPRLDDLLDALDQIRYNMGLTKELPKFDRFSFGEKFEYWAFVWGAVVMGATGFMMWNPINTARFLPGDLIPAAKAAHGGEALLAVLAIIIWHFYNVHIKTFSKAMFNGKLTEHEMVHEHGLELERLNAGRGDPRPAPEVIRNRERWFIPTASILSVGLLVGLYFFTSYEQTAITTLPKRSTQIQVYAPVTPTPTVRAGAPTVSITAKPLPATHDGRTQCNTCHANNVGPKNPVDHAGRTDATCTACHKLGGTAPVAGTTPAATSATPVPGAPKRQPADHVGRPTCLACHQALPKPALPADHAGRADATCAACHPLVNVAPSTSATAVATKAPTTGTTSSAASSAASSAGAPKSQPADHAGRAICVACHQALPKPAMPADHAGRTDATCAACHPLGSAASPSSPASSAASKASAASSSSASSAASKASAASSASSAAASSVASSAGAPKPQPADHMGRAICVACHQALPKPVMPADHAGRADAMCIACHKSP